MSGKGSGSSGRLVWHLRVHPDVIEAVAKQPEKVRIAFKELVDGLRLTPRSRDLDVLPAKALPWPNVYIAPFGGEKPYGILTYQLYADHPAIHLFRVQFWDETAVEEAYRQAAAENDE